MYQFLSKVVVLTIFILSPILSQWQMVLPTMPTKKTYYAIDQFKDSVIVVATAHALYTINYHTYEFYHFLELPYNIRDIYFHSPDTGFVATAEGKIFFTYNNGINWQQAVLENNLSVNSISAYNNIIFFGCSSRTIFKTTDFGQSFTKITCPVTDLFKIYSLNDSVIFIADRTSSVYSNSLYKTTNSGMTWQDIPLGISIYSFKVLDEENIIVGSDNGKILRTIDGLNFNTVFELPSTNRRVAEFVFRDELYGITLIQNESCYITSDGGFSWIKSPSIGLPIRDFNNAFISKDNVMFYTAFQGSFGLSLDFGVSWTALFSGLTILPRGLDFFTEDIGVVVDQSNSSWGTGYAEARATRDGGKTWSKTSASIVMSNDVVFLDSMTVCRVGLYGRVLWSTNGATLGTWYPTNITGVELTSVARMNNEKVFVVGVGGLMAIINKNGTVNYIPPISTSSFTDVDFYDSLRGMVSGWSGVVLSTVDGGNSFEWKNLSFGLGSLISIKMIDSVTAVGIGSYGIFRTSDFGQTWDYIWPYLQDMEKLVDIDFFENRIGVILTNKRRIFCSPNGGITWTPMYLLVDDDYVEKISYPEKHTLYVLGTSLYKNSNFNIVTGIEESFAFKQPQVFELFQNYPNPFNSTSVINFYLEKGSNTKLIIYNIMGEKILTIVNDYLNQGSHSFVFNADNLPSGIYFYTLSSGEYSETKKMILMK